MPKAQVVDFDTERHMKMFAHEGPTVVNGVIKSGVNRTPKPSKFLGKKLVKIVFAIAIGLIIYPIVLALLE